MFEITQKIRLNPTVTLMKVNAPLIAAKAKPGQFVILRTDEDGERIPLTIADYDAKEGTVTIIFQVVGATTYKLNAFEVGQALCDFVGPLGNPTDLQNLNKVAVVGGGVGCAIAYPIAKKLHEMGAQVHSIIGFRTNELVILDKEFAVVSDKLLIKTDDGSAGTKGLVTDALRELLEKGERYDKVIVIGPLPMMKFVCMLTKQFDIPTIVSMNPVMIDGTGMCGGCRLTVGGKIKFACVDGPDFDGHLVDFDEAIERTSTYKEQERHAYDAACNLLKGADL